MDLGQVVAQAPSVQHHLCATKILRVKILQLILQLLPQEQQQQQQEQQQPRRRLHVALYLRSWYVLGWVHDLWVHSGSSEWTPETPESGGFRSRPGPGRYGQGRNFMEFQWNSIKNIYT